MSRVGSDLEKWTCGQLCTDTDSRYIIIIAPIHHFEFSFSGKLCTQLMSALVRNAGADADDFAPYSDSSYDTTLVRFLIK